MKLKMRISLDEACRKYPKAGTHTLSRIYDYVENKVPGGHFLTFVMENNLMKAFNYADTENRRNLDQITMFIYNHVPTICYGSHEEVKTHLTTAVCSLCGRTIKLLDEDYFLTNDWTGYTHKDCEEYWQEWQEEALVVK